MTAATLATASVIWTVLNIWTNCVQGYVIKKHFDASEYQPNLRTGQNTLTVHTMDLHGNLQGDPGPLLHRHKRSDLKWDDVETFYEDKNNFAMYLVLPIIVLVYGGCAVIYCIARCRRYCKKKKRKPASDEEEILEDEPQDDGRPVIPTVSSNHNIQRDGASSSSQVRVNMERDGDTPLPWQVPGDKKPLYPEMAATGAAAAAMAGHNRHNGKQGEANAGFQGDHYPPSYEESYNKSRPMSKPPPYQEKANRRASVEEIITLDPMPAQENDRKRRRPGSRPGSRNSDAPKQPNYDEEREKARMLVRGDRPKREMNHDRIDRERTPDIISHARTKPLEPRYKPNTTSQSDASLMAKQAAQLLRLDHIGKQQGKKQKRLVFVAE